MLTNGSRNSVAMLAIAALVLTACAKKEGNGTDSTAASSTVSADTSAMPAAPPPAAWSDANIVALLDEANAADSTAGALAATKGTAAAVRDFGRRMARDHHQLRTQGAALAKKLNVTPAAPSDDPLPAAAAKEMETLNSTAKGKDFDKAYIDSEVDVHKAVLDIATKGAAQTQTAELKALIQKAAPVIQAHLTLAESIQSKMK
jgi:putative membrane protein